MAEACDVLVIGLGGMGSAALCALARRGVRAIGVEQYDIAHELGSSGAGIRIWRMSQFLDPAYVPLMRHALHHWARLERDADEQLVHRTGGLDIGRSDTGLITGSKQAAAAHGLAHEILSAREAMRRFPAWRLAADMEAVYQPDAGFMSAERCILAHVRVAMANGAEARIRERVTHIDDRADHVRVVTSRGTYEAGRLIITAGPWSRTFAPTLASTLVPERQVVGWLAPRTPTMFAPSTFPIFIVEDDTGNHYGFPEYDRPGVKLGRHGHRSEMADPDTVRRDIDADDEAVLTRFVTRYWPDMRTSALALKTCLYTNTPDSHFVVDRLPGRRHTWIAAGFSGHGYKYCAGIGEILADLAMTGTTRENIALFEATRTAVSP